MLKSVESSAAQPPMLRRAIAFIHDNADSDIGVTEIAEALNVTPRSIQYTFRRHLGTTPLGTCGVVGSNRHTATCREPTRPSIR